ncbi:hypothetical protein [Halogranum amylolyticum]|uniref:hypothetical protein n=1 Tax=Halogranum amylolyticum TaxID=660520 RepID=UPI001FCD7D88|nr:hypothetical protein [Halogranum amylolyticum]
MAEDKSGFQTARGVTAGIMGLLVGAVVAFAFTNIGGSSVLFLITFAGVSYYLYDRKHSARTALGSGLYILALWILAAPIMFYIPIIGGANTETAAGSGAAIGGALGILIWGFAGLLVAVIVAAVGYFVNRGAATPTATSTSS